MNYEAWDLSYTTELSPFDLKWNSRLKSNRGFICDWIWVKSLCKCIITTKAALLRFTVVSFSGKPFFSGVHFYDSIKISFFKTLRRLDTTWNFARSITRVSTHEPEYWEHCVCTQSSLKRRFLNYSLSYYSALGGLALFVCHDGGGAQEIQLLLILTLLILKVPIMLLNECLTYIRSQIKPQLLFGESFTLKVVLWDRTG